MLRTSAVLLSLAVVIRADMESYIVGGNFASIAQYPYSAFLSVACVNSERDTNNWICGSSVINQRLLLTAAHCVYTCSNGTHVSVNLGDELPNGGVIRSARSYIIHEKYDPKRSSFDIALIKLYRPVKFSKRISRVALMKSPPYSEPAKVAGWGLFDEDTKETSVKLKYVVQEVWKHVECEKKFGIIPIGTICASSKRSTDYPAQGDSGSGLVVRGYIQIGLVSYKVPSVAPNVIIYTDVGFFYNWIMFHAKRLYCFTPKDRKIVR